MRCFFLLTILLTGCATIQNAAEVATPSVLQLPPNAWHGKARVPRAGFGEGDYRGIYKGSAVAIAKDRAITALHCVENVAEIKVNLAAGRTVTAKVAAQDAPNDLALLQLPADVSLIPAILGDSSRLRIGDRVLTIGYPSGLRTVSAGIVSGLGVDLQNYKSLIQTDAALNFGNSGGGLFNDRGELVGVNTAKIVGLERIGLAIPINTVREFINAHR